MPPVEPVPVEPVEPVAPVEPVDPVEPVEPVPVEPVAPVEPVEPVDPVPPVEPVPVEPVAPVEPVEPVEPVPPVAPVPPVLPVEPVEPVEPVDPLVVVVVFAPKYSNAKLIGKLWLLHEPAARCRIPTAPAPAASDSRIKAVWPWLPMAARKVRPPFKEIVALQFVSTEYVPTIPLSVEEPFELVTVWLPITLPLPSKK